MARSSAHQTVRGFLTRPTVYYSFTGTVAIVATWQIVATAHATFELNDQKLFTFTISVFLPIITLLWGGRWVADRIRANRTLARTLGDEKDASDDSFRELVRARYGEALVENIFSYEAFWRKGYQTDLNRHTVATAIVMAASVASISMGLLLFSRPPSAENDSAYVIGLAGALPALVTATALKIWLETRNNLNATRQQVDLLLRQRIRLILFWSGRDQFATAELFQQYVHSCSMFLNYLRSGSDGAPQEPATPSDRGGEVPKEPARMAEILGTRAR